MSSYLAPTFLLSPPTPVVGCDSAELFGLPMMVPADFAMVYKSGPTHAGIAPQSFVRLQPLAPRTWTIEVGEAAHPQRTSNEETIKRVVQVNQSDVLELYHEVILQSFFSLRGNYTNPDVFHGGRSSLRVVANGDTKHVSVANMTIKRFRDVVAMLYDLCDRR